MAMILPAPSRSCFAGPERTGPKYETGVVNIPLDHPVDRYLDVPVPQPLSARLRVGPAPALRPALAEATLHSSFLDLSLHISNESFAFLIRLCLAGGEPRV